MSVDHGPARAAAGQTQPRTADQPVPPPTQHAPAYRPAGLPLPDRRRHRGVALSLFAGVMIAVWLGLVFLAHALAGDEKTAGYGAVVGFFVLAMAVVTYVLFMMAVDSDKA